MGEALDIRASQTPSDRALLDSKVFEALRRHDSWNCLAATLPWHLLLMSR